MVKLDSMNFRNNELQHNFNKNFAPAAGNSLEDFSFFNSAQLRIALVSSTDAPGPVVGMQGNSLSEVVVGFACFALSAID